MEHKNHETNQNLEGYISLNDASQNTPYAAGYLSLLARKGSLQAEKVGNIWYTKPEWMQEYLERVADRANTSQTKDESAEVQQAKEEGFLPLSEAEKICDYSGTYLALRIRQGKLQGEKIGRNWFTKKEWIDSYVAEISGSEITSAETSIDTSHSVLESENPRNQEGVEENSTPAPAASAEIISLDQVAEEYQYSLSVLEDAVQNGTLQAKHIGGHWYTRTDWLHAYQSNKHIDSDVVEASVQQSEDVATSSEYVLSQEMSDDVEEITTEGVVSIASEDTDDTNVTTKKSRAYHFRMPRFSFGVVLTVATVIFVMSGYASAAFADYSVSDVVATVGRTVKSKTVAMFDSVHKVANLKNNQTPNIKNQENTKSQITKDAGVVAGESVERGDEESVNLGEQESVINTTSQIPGLTDSPTPSSKKSSFSDILSVFRSLQGYINESLSFINPSSPSSIIGRLQGTVAEVGNSVTTINLFNGTTEERTNIATSPNQGNILQPAGGYIAEVDSDNDPETPNTTVVGTINVQQAGSVTPAGPSANSVTNNAQPDAAALSIVSSGTGPIVQGVNNQGNVVFQVSEEGVLKVGEASTYIDTDSVETGTLVARTAVTAPTLRIGNGVLQVSSGNVSVSGGLSTASLDVAGAVVLNNTLSVAQTITALNGIVSQAAINTPDLSVSNVATIARIAPPSNASVVEVDTGLRVNGDTIITGATNAVGDVTVQGTLTAGTFAPQNINTQSLTSTLITTRSLTATGPISASGVSAPFGSFSELSADNLILGNDASDVFTVQGATTLSHTLAVSGITTLSSALQVAGNTTLSGGLTVGSIARISGLATVGSLAISGGSFEFGNGSATSSISSANGNIGIGTTTPSKTFSVGGELITSATTTASAIVTTDSNATSVFAGFIDVLGTGDNATSTFSGNLQVKGTIKIGENSLVLTESGFSTTNNSFSLQPAATVTAHTFGAWAIDVADSAVLNSAFAVNPATAIADSNLLGLAVGGSPKFIVDAEGDVYANTLTLVGSTSLGSTTASYFAVEGSTDLGDSNNDTLTIAARIDDLLQIATSVATQLATGYDLNNYLAFRTDSGGTTTLDAIGGAYASLVVADPLQIATTTTFALDVRSAEGIQALVVDTTNNAVTASSTLAVSGATTLSSTLQVNSAATFQNALQLTSATATSTIAGNLTLAGLFDITGGTIQFGTGSATSTLSSSNGNFGIGTTTPSSLFSVGGASLVQGTQTAANFIATSATASSTFAFDITSASGNLTVQSSGTTNSLLLNPYGGTVGIATSTPWAQLSVVGQGSNPSFVVSDSSGAVDMIVTSSGLVGIGSSTPNALLSVQGGTMASLFEVTDSNTSTLAFSIASTTGEILTRGDSVQQRRADLVSLSGINDVFVYDTTRDSDGGAWTNNAAAQSSSWYNETIDNTGSNCTLLTDDRCGSRAFPSKAIIVTTDSAVHIFDAKDNTLWMTFLNGGTTTISTHYILKRASDVNNVSYALNGTVYVGNANWLLTSINFKNEKVVDYVTDFAGSDGFVWTGNIAQRNQSGYWITDGMELEILGASVNDVHGSVVNGKTYIAVATNGGVSVINETDGTIVDFTQSGYNEIQKVFLTSQGELYFIQKQDSADAYYFSASYALPITDVDLTAWRDATYNAGGTPLLQSSNSTAEDMNDLYVTSGTSFIDGTSNTIYVATDVGVSKISEKQGDESNGAVKYYQSATTTEEMIGDIRGMWPFETQNANAPDASIKGNTLTGTNISGDDYVTGVRGTAIDLDGSTEYFSRTSDSDFSFGTGDFSFGIWIQSNSASNPGSVERITHMYTNPDFISTHFNTSGQIVFTLSDDNTSTQDATTTAVDYYDANWHHAVFQSVNGGIEIYVDGTKVAETPLENATGSLDPTAIYIGSYHDGASNFDGQIDEPFATAEALTPSQIKHMYETGKRALENHTTSQITGITNADSYQQLYGSTASTTTVVLDEINNIMYAGTNDGSNTGGVSAISLYSDSLVDVWSADSALSITDSEGTSFGSDNIVSVSVSGRYPSTLVIGTDAELWVETEAFSFDTYRNTSINPHGEHLVQTDLTVKNDLVVGRTFSVGGRVAGESIVKPSFAVAADGTVTVREDIILAGGTDLITMDGINDVFVYDTTKDFDAGTWRHNAEAKSSSWYIEQIDATGERCDMTSHDRCGSRAFPQKAIIVARNTGIYIFDAQDNTLWMTFNAGVTYQVWSMTGGSADVYALNGKVYLSSNATNEGLGVIDFKHDTGYRYYDASNGGRYQGKGVIGKRNETLTSFGTQIATLYLVNDEVKDIHARYINGKQYVGVATGAGDDSGGGITIINETDETAVHHEDTQYALGGQNWQANAVWITADGGVWWNANDLADGSANGLRFYAQGVTQGTTNHDSAPQEVYAPTATPGYDPSGVAGASKTVNSIYVSEGTSFIDGVSDTVYIGHYGGVTKLSQKQGDATNGAVKYYTQDYITEEMVGSIAGMWGFNRPTSYSSDEDISVNNYTLTTSGSMTSANVVPGVRGSALDFDGSDDVATNTSFASLTGSVSMGAWFNIDAVGDLDDAIMAVGDGTTGQHINLRALSNSGWAFENCASGSKISLGLDVDGTDQWHCGSVAPIVGKWQHAAVVYDKGALTGSLYVDGSLVLTTRVSELSLATNVYVGQDVHGSSVSFNGRIDEAFVTGEALTPSQIKHIYESGKQALEQKSLSAVTNAETVGEDRIGDSSISVEEGGWIGSFVEITGGIGVGQTRRIVATSTNTFYVDPPFDITPDTTSDFQIISNSIYIKDSSVATTVQSVFVDEDAGVLYAGVNNGDNTGGVTAIGLDTDTILDVWHHQSGKRDDRFSSWNADDIVALGASSHSSNNDDALGVRSDILAIATDAELWASSAQISVRDALGNSSEEQTNIRIKNEAVFEGNLAITDGQSQSVFGVNQDTKNVTIREDIEFGSETAFTSLSNVNDVFVYDTTQDSDGGEWTCNDTARGTSWYNEALNTATRGSTKCFPRKAIIVSTDGDTGVVYIYDAQDNSMWMRFDAISGSAGWGAQNMISIDSATSDAVFALNGKIYSVGNPSGRMVAIDFKADDATVWHTSSGRSFWNGSIQDRNDDSVGYTLVADGVVIVNNNINDVHAAVIDGKTYVAVATDGGVSVINESDGVVVDSSTEKHIAVFIAGDGTLYSVQDNGDTWSTQFVRVNYDVTTESDGFNYETAYTMSGGSSATSRPYFSALPNGNLFVTTGTSHMDIGSNTLYVGTDSNLAILNENQTTVATSSVKYYTKNYISEEMIGDIRGMWGFYHAGLTSIASSTSANIDDISMGANDLTSGNANGTGMQYVSGVRNTGIQFDGTDDFLVRYGDSDLQLTSGFTFSAWVNYDNPGDGNVIVTAHDPSANMWFLGHSNSACSDGSTLEFGRYNSGWACADTGITPPANEWVHVVVTHDGSTARVYYNGALAVSTTMSASSAPQNLFIGALGGGGDAFDGVIDEPMLAAEIYTASQIKHIYDSGKRALESGFEATANDATSTHSAFRIGVSDSNDYTAGQFVGSVVQIYDGPGSATTTRFVTQTASSTNDYYVQFSPDHSAALADNDTFSVGPNLFAGTTNRVTGLSVDPIGGYIYVGTTDNDGTDGSVSKIALASDTLVDVWHTDTGKEDDHLQSYGGASTTAIAYTDNTLVVANNTTNRAGIWSETSAETLDRKLTKAKSVFTVIDHINTPKIVATNGTLTFGVGTSTSLTIKAATTTPDTVQIKVGSGKDLFISGEHNIGLYINHGQGDNATILNDWEVQTHAIASMQRIIWADGDDLLVAIGDGSGTSNIQTSPDGETWTTRSTPNSNTWYDVAYSPSLDVYAAVSGDGTNRAISSTDAISWTERSTPSYIWRGVTWGEGAGVFVAVSSSGPVMSSTNGTSWTERTPATSSSWQDVAWSEELDLFVAVATGGQIMTSPDGTTWTSRTAPASSTWRDVTWSSSMNLFIAVASGGSPRVMTSPDGITWTGRSAAEDNAWFGVTALDSGLAVAVANDGTNRTMYSTDGIAWTALAAAQGNTWYDVTWASGLSKFVAISVNGSNQVMTTDIGTVEPLVSVGVGTTAPEARLQVSGGGLCVGSDSSCNADNNTEGVVYSSSSSMSTYDVAENYPTKDDTLIAGELVAIADIDGAYVERVATSTTEGILGVISSAPGVLLGGFDSNQYVNEIQVPVALSGRVPVKVTLENGSIEKGDYLTISQTVAGAATKLVGSGASIGIALQAYTGDPITPIYEGQPEDQIMTFVSLEYQSARPWSGQGGGIILKNSASSNIAVFDDTAGFGAGFNNTDTPQFYITSAGNVGIQTLSPTSSLTIGTIDNTVYTYIQLDSESGPPPSADCNSNAYRGRTVIDHENSRMYVCTGAVNGWDYVELTD